MTDTRTDYTARAPKTSLPGFSESVHFSGWPLRVGVISNPLSGRNRKGMAPIAKVLREQPHVSQCEAQTPGEVASALADFARKGVALVVINGGDGTIQSVLTVLFNRKPFEAQPVLALLRSGTASMIARDVGLSGSPAQALRRLLAWANGSTRDAVILQRHTLRMQLGADEEPRFGMFFGTGAITKSIRFCHEKIESLGLRGELGPGLTLAWFILAHTNQRYQLSASSPYHGRSGSARIRIAQNCHAVGEHAGTLISRSASLLGDWSGARALQRTQWRRSPFTPRPPLLTAWPAASLCDAAKWVLQPQCARGEARATHGFHAGRRAFRAQERCTLHRVVRWRQGLVPQMLETLRCT